MKLSSSITSYLKRTRALPLIRTWASVCEEPTPGTLKGPAQPRVVIVGAGIAGLAAAATLAQAGIENVIILEAYGRPGGRIHSCWIGDIVAELGAHWKPELGTAHPLVSMNATEDPPRPGVPGAEHTRGLFSSVIRKSGKMPYPPSLRAYYKFRQIEEEAAKMYCLGGNKMQGSLINFISLRVQQELHEFPEHQQHDAARIMFGLAHMLSARGADDTAMLCADHLGCFMNMPGGEVRVPLGLVGVLAPLLRQIPGGAIKYFKPVSCIFWGTCQKLGYRACVGTCDGEEYPADYVIITMSLGVLFACANQMFCPPLPSEKMDAMRCLGYGFANKIYLEYCRPFWYWHRGRLNFTFCRNELSGISNWTRGITSIEVVPNSKHVLCVWVVGREAAVMESLCDKDVAENITDLLRIIANNSNIPYPISVLRSHWSSDPYFNGAYSYDCQCTDGDAQRALGCPVPGPNNPVPPVLLFAGEATVPGHFATVSGARISGVREAVRIVELTLKHGGPPIPNEFISDREQYAKKCEEFLMKENLEQ